MQKPRTSVRDQGAGLKQGVTGSDIAILPRRRRVPQILISAVTE